MFLEVACFLVSPTIGYYRYALKKGTFVNIFFNVIFLHFIFTTLFLSACSSYELAESFFRKLMLEEVGIFTLWGSKPLTFFEIDYPNMEREKEISIWYENLSEEEKEKQIFLLQKKDIESEW